MSQPQIKCADCGKPIGETGPPDGWQLEDGRTVCQACCAADLCKLGEALKLELQIHNLSGKKYHQKERNKSGH